jgi:hypothetical protein
MESITIVQLQVAIPKLQLTLKGRELSYLYTKGGVTKERGAWPPQGGRTKC